VPDILCIVSKAVFEKDARVGGKVVGLGDVWPVDRYNSTNKTLATATGGGRIFLVTVRPPDERLWFLGVIDSPKQTKNAFVSSKPNTLPVTNITALRKTIVFESGKGLSQDKGTLGMSLQTPRALAASDVQQILAAVSGAGAQGAQGAQSPAALGAPMAAPKPTGRAAELLAEVENAPKNEGIRERVARELVSMGALAEARQALSGIAHLDAHDETGLPCLCKKCWELAEATCELGGMTFKRDLVIKNGRVLFYWAPSELDASAGALRNSVRASLARRLAALARARKRQPRPEF